MTDFKMSRMEYILLRMPDVLKRFEEVCDMRNVPAAKLFTDSFMEEHSSFTSFQVFLGVCGIEAELMDDLLRLPGEQLDAYASEHTDFSTWMQMLDEAVTLYIWRDLSFLARRGKKGAVNGNSSES